MASSSSVIEESIRKVYINPDKQRESTTSTSSTHDTDSTETVTEKTKKKLTRSSDSYDFSEFSESLQVKGLLGELEKKSNSRTTSTSAWNRPSRRRTSVYKLFKVKRWQLIDEDMIFDPLLRSNKITLSGVALDEITGVRKPDSHEESRKLCLYDLSVTRNLEYLSDENAKKLNELDRALSELDLMGTEDKQTLLRTQYAVYEQLGLQTKFKSWQWWISKVFQILENLANNVTQEELVFTDLFLNFFERILQLLQEEAKEEFHVRQNFEGQQRFHMVVRDLVVSSEADLYIWNRGSQMSSLIAVVEVKGIDGQGNIIESSCTSECKKSDNKKEDEVDFDDMEDRICTASPPNEILANFDPVEKRVLRNFLPQLIGEMMCTFFLKETYNPNSKTILNCKGCKEYYGTYRLGISITGLTVRFIATIFCHDDEETAKKLSLANLCERTPNCLHYNDKLRTVVFITRGFDIVKKTDRRIVIKTIVCAALLNGRVKYNF